MSSEMNEITSELQSDLKQKFDHLCLVHDQPTLFVSEYFFNIRNSIDYDAEKLLLDLKRRGVIHMSFTFEDADAEDAATINKRRKEFIEYLKPIEEKTLKNLPEKPKSSSQVKFASIKQRINQFESQRPSQNADIDEYENAYAQIAADIIDHTFQIEKSYLGNQTIFYASLLNKQEKLGTLVYLANVYLSMDQIDCIK